MICKNCGTELDNDMRFCPTCGTEVPIIIEPARKQMSFCMKCGAVLVPNARFCMECGASVQTVTPPAPQLTQNTVSYVREKEQKRRPGKRAFWYVAASACLIIALIGAAILYSNGHTAINQDNRSDSNKSSAQAPREKTSGLVWKIEYGKETKTTHYVYNLMGEYERIEEMSYPETEPYNTRVFTYNAFGKLTHWEDDEGASADFNDSGTCIYRRYSDGDFMRFDDEGNLLEKYDARFPCFDKYTYNEQGQVDYCEESRNPEDTPHLVIRYEYSDDGLFCKQTMYTPDGERVYTLGSYEECTYDVEGRVIREDIYDKSDELFRTTQHEYDTDGNVLMELDTLYGNGESSEIKTLYEYDADGNLLQIYRDGNVLGGGVQYEIYNRDDSGNLLTVSLHDIDNRQGIDFTWVRKFFEYDEQGNLSKEYLYSAPDYDSDTNTFSGKYESGGVGNWETMTIYVYDYDGDPYDKMPSSSENL